MSKKVFTEIRFFCLNSGDLPPPPKKRSLPKLWGFFCLYLDDLEKKKKKKKQNKKVFM